MQKDGGKDGERIDHGWIHPLPINPSKVIEVKILIAHCPSSPFNFINLIKLIKKESCYQLLRILIYLLFHIQYTSFSVLMSDTPAVQNLVDSHQCSIFPKELL